MVELPRFITVYHYYFFSEVEQNPPPPPQGNAGLDTAVRTIRDGSPE